MNDKLVATIGRALESIETAQRLVLDNGSLEDLLVLVEQEYFTAAQVLLPNVRKSLELARVARQNGIATVWDCLTQAKPPVQVDTPEPPPPEAEVVSAPQAEVS